MLSSMGLVALLMAAISSLSISYPGSNLGSEPSFLEDVWNYGQGKGYLWSGGHGSEPYILHELLAASPRVRRSFPSEDDASDLFDFILAKSQQYGVSPFLVLSLIDVESGFRPDVVSSRGAVGLMQLLPTTAEEVANSTGMIWYPGLLQDPKANIELGLRYMARLKRQFGSEARVLTAYNIGPNALREKLALGEFVSLAYFNRVKNRMSYYSLHARISGSRSRTWARAWL
jgi:hypothetical protein